MSAKLQEYRQYLSIDRTDLDACLMEQPETYEHVAQEVVRANASRDQLKLELEELQAQLDQDLRAEAAKSDERITEAALQNKLRSLPKIQAAQRAYLAARETAEQWAALKEAFQQRSYMLKELVALFIAQRHDLYLEQGSDQSRQSLAQSNKLAGDQLRKAKRAAQDLSASRGRK